MAKPLLTELPERLKSKKPETRDPRTRWSKVNARGQELSFRSTGVSFPVDYESSDPTLGGIATLLGKGNSEEN